MRSSTSVLAGRARMLSALFMCAAALLAVRLYFVQIVHVEDYQKSARGQYVEVSSERQGRGDIFFSKKEGDLVAAAVMQSGWGLAIVPAEITDPEQVFETLSSIVPLDKERFFANAAKLGDPYEDVGFRLSDSAAARIRKEKIPGVILAPDQWRSYPADVLAAHAIGFVGYKGDAKVGVYGLEARYEDSLVKTSGLYVNPFAEIFANVGAALSSDPALNKGSVITSIEPQVQARLEETLSGVLKTYSPKEAAGIVMDPHTGEIIAMAIRPTFDPNTYNTVDDPSVFTNTLVENVYEMGSIMKPLTVAAGIDVGAITPKTTYNDKGCIEKSGKKICNYDGKARGVVPIQEVLNQSLNLGVSFVADTMGHNVFSEYIHAFGLGEKTGIDLPNEARGIIYAIDRGYDVDYASASFGQSAPWRHLEAGTLFHRIKNGHSTDSHSRRWRILRRPFSALVFRLFSRARSEVHSLSGRRRAAWRGICLGNFGAAVPRYREVPDKLLRYPPRSMSGRTEEYVCTIFLRRRSFSFSRWKRDLFWRGTSQR